MAADEDRYIVALRMTNDPKGDRTDEIYDWGSSDHVTLERLIKKNIPNGYTVLGFWPWNEWHYAYLRNTPNSHSQSWIRNKVAEMRARGIVHMRNVIGGESSSPVVRGRKPRVELVQEWLEKQDHDELAQRAWEAVQACSKGGSL